MSERHDVVRGDRCGDPAVGHAVAAQRLVPEPAPAQRNSPASTDAIDHGILTGDVL
jgi:hypothetical protein